MSIINGMESVNQTRNNYNSTINKTNTESASKTSDKVSDKTSSEETSVVYEKSSSNLQANGSVYNSRAEMINMLKSDLEAHVQSLKDMALDLMSKQSNAFSIANNKDDKLSFFGKDNFNLGKVNDDDIWAFLASGDYTIDEAARKKAEEAISEDGYWGVKQTSERIINFAKALAGDDSSKADMLFKAFQKGFNQATSIWGKDLPDISKKTYEAVEKGFDDWKNGNKDDVSKESEKTASVDAGLETTT
ncbi:hypothetical protein SAMN05216249_10983 [Acetitomaculum ruminis DSM 5522]|uniref:DUF5610 domain-containing protein n=1 Tax=Acetitomaculum ruminis DSM 5522 TaxID=1120918 RepID=A0A1I0YBC2_9FIRM|nr:hypothetical protein [Acetitomaculum ruminis]SFB10604.1 hypothetical protein SAMN05216249_10983 [Acetitomaculum ruminis DSM 5522]